jgi:hypothetical protein
MRPQRVALRQRRMFEVGLRIDHADALHHRRVGIQRRERFAVGLLPGTQPQAGGRQRRAGRRQTGSCEVFFTSSITA